MWCVLIVTNSIRVRMDNFDENLSSSRSTTPLGIRSIFEFNSDNENIPLIPDFNLVDDFGRESLGILNLDSLDVGRESLWIANLKTDCTSEVKITSLIDKGNSDDGLLNTGFLFSAKDSARSSLSSYDSVCSSLGLLNVNNNISPRITSCCKSDVVNYGCDLLSNKRCSLSPVHFNFNEKQNKNQLHQIDPLSSMIEDILSVQSFTEHFREENFDLKSPVKRSNSFMIYDSNDAFNDSVFIEANHLAARIEDGSIFDLGVRENDMLDSIQEPDDLVNLSVENVEPVQYETKTVFQKIDKILPPLSNNTSSEEKNENKNMTKSRNPKDILSTLSEILNNDNLISEKQKSEGQNMISNLAAILISNGSVKTSNLDDSGHSSIEIEAVVTSPEHECYEVLDLRKKKSSEITDNVTDAVENCYPLDLSLKSKSFDSVNIENAKVMPPKYNSIHQKTLTNNNNIGSSCLTLNKVNNNMNDIKNKFKLKKAEESSKKGPMRAVVPLDNMARRKSGISRLPMTPKRNEVQSDMKSRKPVTPVNGLILKPVAQSTPEGPAVINKPITSSNQNSRIAKNRSSLHGINKKQEQSNKKLNFVRRHSVDDINKSHENEKVLSRSSSVGGKLGLASTVNNVQQIVTVKQNLRSKTGNLPVLKENRSKSVTRFSYCKKSGKENFS